MAAGERSGSLCLTRRAARPPQGCSVPTGLCCSAFNPFFGDAAAPSTGLGGREGFSRACPAEMPPFTASHFGLALLLSLLLLGLIFFFLICLFVCFSFGFFFWFVFIFLCLFYFWRWPGRPAGTRVARERGCVAAAPSSCQAPEVPKAIPGRETFIAGQLTSSF